MSNTIFVGRTGQGPLHIRGEIIASGESSANNAHSNYSGSTGQWQSVKIYKTVKGRFVVSITHFTQWQGQHDTEEAAVFPDAKACIDFLTGRVPGWLVTDLVDELGVKVGLDNIAEEVE